MPQPTTLHRLPIYTEWRGSTNTGLFTQYLKPATVTDVARANGQVTVDADAVAPSLLVGHLRGRRLFGRRVALPTGVHGVVLPHPIPSADAEVLRKMQQDTKHNTEDLKKKRCREGEDETPNRLQSDISTASPLTSSAEAKTPATAAKILNGQQSEKCLGYFSEFTVWEHDKAVTGCCDDDAGKLLLWIELARVIHGQDNSKSTK